MGHNQSGVIRKNRLRRAKKNDETRAAKKEEKTGAKKATAPAKA